MPTNETANLNTATSKNPAERLKALAHEARRHYQHILSAALAATTVLIIYGRDLEILANEALQNEALSHVLLIPFFAGFLLYLKRDLVKAAVAFERNKKDTTTKYIDELVGLALCLVAFLLYWYGSNTFYAFEYHILSLPIFLIGLTLVLFNLKATLMLLPPILFLFFLVPIPSEYFNAIGGIMANSNTLASYNILKTIGIPVTLATTNGPPTLTLPSVNGQSPSSFTVDLPCSGIYSLIAFATFATFLAVVTTAKASRKLILVALGFATFEVLNVLRITAIISIAHWFGQEIAMYMFHAVAGLILIFIGMLITLFIGEKLLKIQILPPAQETQPCPKCAKNLTDFCSNCGRHLNRTSRKISSRFWAKLLLLLLGCTLVTFSINAPTFAVAKESVGVKSGPDWENVTIALPEITDYRLNYLYSDTTYAQIARQDASIWYSYTSLTNYTKPAIFVLIGVADSISNLHNWEVCLVSWQTAQGLYPLVAILDQGDTQLIKDVPLIARYIVFKTSDNYTQTTLYWYEKATFKTGLTVTQKYVRLSLVIASRNSTGYKEHENELLTIGQKIAAYWEPLKTQSLISLGIPAQQTLLIASIAFIAFTKTTQYSNDWRKKNNNAKIFSKFAPKQEKEALQTILDLAKEKKTMKTAEIETALNEKMKKPTKPDVLLSTLTRLKEYGFIKEDVISINNKPVLIWKTSVSSI
jgi:exosortase